MFGFNKKKILIIGMPDLVLYCISALKRARKNIVGVITSPVGDATYDYMKDFLAQHRLLHLENTKNFKDEKLLQQVRALKPDIALVCSFNFLLPKELYEIPKFGTINFHPSLLPDYRGANPYFHVLNNDEKQTGITMHFMDETFDTGDIIKQVPIEILDNDTMGSLFTRMNEVTAQLCVETIDRLEKGETLPRIKQNKVVDYKKAPKIRQDSDDVRIDWTKPINDIERFIRALNPFFGAISYYNDTPIKFWSVEMIENKSAGNLPAGTICEITPEEIYISAKDGFIKTNILSLGEKTYFSRTEILVQELKLEKGKKFE